MQRDQREQVGGAEGRGLRREGDLDRLSAQEFGRGAVDVDEEHRRRRGDAVGERRQAVRVELGRRLEEHAAREREAARIATKQLEPLGDEVDARVRVARHVDVPVGPAQVVAREGRREEAVGALEAHRHRGPRGGLRSAAARGERCAEDPQPKRARESLRRPFRRRDLAAPLCRHFSGSGSGVRDSLDEGHVVGPVR